jgi:hypothetical protein
MHSVLTRNLPIEKCGLLPVGHARLRITLDNFKQTSEYTYCLKAGGGI